MYSPLVETIDVSKHKGIDLAACIYSHWQERSDVFWLDSGCNPMRLGRFSFLGIDPYGVLTADDRASRLAISGESDASFIDPWDALTAAVKPVFSMSRTTDEIPFLGGLVGYMSYDLGQRTAGIACRNKQGLSMPDMVFRLYDAIVCIDNRNDQLHIVSTGLPLRGRDQEKRATARLQWLRSEVSEALATPYAPPPRLEATVAWRHEQNAPIPDLQSTFTRAAYLAATQDVLSAIRSGVVEQVNLAQRLSISTSFSASQLYHRLRMTSPAPFGALLRIGDKWILSSSPERFLLMQDDHIEMRPIKGTRPRGVDAALDARNRHALLVSEKDKSEHMMIVDAEKGQLRSVCVPDSVAVGERMVCEEYRTVFHLVSTVVGKLDSQADRVRCIRALFPPGSITGRPKDRAIEMIDELEPVRRGVYTGAIGYLGVGGNVDLSVAIRTLILSGKQAHFHVGGAIVAASDPEDEYEETLDKAEGMVRALLEPRRS